MLQYVLAHEYQLTREKPTNKGSVDLGLIISSPVICCFILLQNSNFKNNLTYSQFLLKIPAYNSFYTVGATFQNNL